MDPTKAIRLAMMVAKGVSSVTDKPLVKKDGGEVGHEERQQNLSNFMEGADPVLADEKGQPKLFYHATYAKEPIISFNRMWSTNVRRPSMDTVGTWFSDNPSTEGGAGMYADSEGASIYPMHLSAKKLKTYHRFDDFLRDMHEAEGRKFEDQNPKGIGSTEGLREKLKAQGYDGLHFPKNDSFDLGKQIDQFDSSIQQMKSAFSAESKRRWDAGDEISLSEQKAHQKKFDGLIKKRMELEKKRGSIGSTEFGRQNVVVVFEPHQIKSPWNRGTYDPNEEDTHKATGGVIHKDKGGEVEDYQGAHTSPGPQNGAPLHDLTQLLPDDIYGPNAVQYYGTGDRAKDAESFAKVHRLRNKPNLGVQVYRAVPKDPNIKQINPKDWVTINKDYAIDHGESTLRGKYKILSKIVSAKHLYNSGDSIHEWGYHPDPVEKATGGVIHKDKGGGVADGGAVYKAKGGNVKTENVQKTIRRALMVARDAKAIGGSEMGDEETPSSLPTNQPAASTRTMISTPAPNSEGVKGIVVPRHMLEGRTYAGEKRGGEKVAGMNEINAARAAVYGSENRNPLKVGSIQRTHKAVLDQHFEKSIPEQISAENEALSRLRKAKHIGENANTLDSSEKTDTVKYEPDPYEPWTSKGIAGYALYTSGHGDNEVKHVLKTCPGQTDGCGGGVDENGIVDTSKGTCFAPNAESQYVNAAVRRACHEQAKFDPAMTKDWILAHVGSLRSVSEKADKKGKKTMFRPNVVDETDRSSRHVIEGLNAQRSEKGLPPIIANSYGKTNELHDPENGYYVTHSNVGPKVKNGALIGENVSRDKQRIRGTILAADPQDFVNKQGNLTPAKNSYLVTDVKRYSDLDKRMQGAITHAKYWSAGRDERDLRNTQEDGQEPEAHFDGQGNPTTPDKAHYGHITLNGLRYDYQKQHILHPRMVSVPFTVTNKETGKKETKIKKIPTDSRFKDNDFLPPDEERFKAKNGKLAGAILMTTPTESTSHLGHETSFTHHVDDAAVDHALRNNGEYEIDSPMTQEAAKNKRFAAPQPLELKMRPKAFARGGAVGERDEDYSMGLPEQHFHAQKHIGHTHDHEEGHAMPHGHGAMPVNGPVVDRALHLVSHLSRR